MTDIFYHYGDPCAHCGTSHDEVAPGPCQGDRTKAVVLRYCSLGVRWDGVEHYRWVTSDGVEHECHQHVSYSLPFYHFGLGGDSLRNPPPYDIRLERGQRVAARARTIDAMYKGGR